jgi:hypothetical protein
VDPFTPRFLDIYQPEYLLTRGFSLERQGNAVVGAVKGMGDQTSKEDQFLPEE